MAEYSLHARHSIPRFLGNPPLNKLGRIKPGYFLRFFTFGLVLVLVVGGIAGRYVKIRVVKDYWRTLMCP